MSGTADRRDGDRPDGDRPALRRLVPVPTRRSGTAPRAADLSGVGVSGEPLRVPVASSVGAWLLLFLGARCDGCLPFWPALSDPQALGVGGAAGIAVVTRPAPEEDPVVLRTLVPNGASDGAAVVLSTSAWKDYRVQGPPFFVLVVAGRVVTEGVAWSVEQVASAVRGTRSPTAGGAPPCE